MGQKVSPTGFRLGVTEDWRSRWYSDKDYAKNLENDLAIRSYLDKQLAHAAVSRVEIERAGDKIKVIITITADRDYDFVKIVDKRAACLEPVNQLSGYQWGMKCYVSPKDNTTNFYFNRLSKGKHFVEMEYYIDRKGDYQSGSCTAECTYSPEFGGRTEAYKMTVNN